MDLSDFEVDRNRRRGCGGKRESMSVNISGGIFAIGDWRGIFGFLKFCLTMKMKKSGTVGGLVWPVGLGYGT